MSPEFRNIDDAQLLRALAHPLRIRLIGTLHRDGPATASSSMKPYLARIRRW